VSNKRRPTYKLKRTRNSQESDWRCFRGCAISSSHGCPPDFFPERRGGQIQGCKKSWRRLFSPSPSKQWSSL